MRAIQLHIEYFGAESGAVLREDLWRLYLEKVCDLDGTQIDTIILAPEQDQKGMIAMACGI